MSTIEKQILTPTGEQTNIPFINKFQIGTIGNVVNELSSLSINTPYTYDKKKVYSLYIENSTDRPMITSLKAFLNNSGSKNESSNTNDNRLVTLQSQSNNDSTNTLLDVTGTPYFS